MKLLATLDQDRKRVLYNYDNNQLALITLDTFENHDLLVHSLPLEQVNLPTLARELIFGVVQYLLLARLSTRNLDLVFELALISKPITFFLYTEIFGFDDVPQSYPEMINRLGKTLRLLERVHDDFVTEFNDSKIPKIGMSFRRLPSHYQPSIIIPQIYPWQFDQEPDLFVLDNIRGISSLIGPFNGNTIWIMGKNRNGIYNCEEFQYPVFVFCLTEFTGALLPIDGLFENNEPFRAVAAMLRIMYGENAGVYFMVRKFENRYDFITNSNTLMQL